MVWRFPRSRFKGMTLKKEKMNILLESGFAEQNRFFNLDQGQDSLGEISKELDKLLNS